MCLAGSTSVFWLHPDPSFHCPCLHPPAPPLTAPDNSLHPVPRLPHPCADNLWSRFVVLEVDDQKTLVNMSDGSNNARQRPWGNFRPVVTQYGGNTSQPITHPEGDASKYAA